MDNQPLPGSPAQPDEKRLVLLGVITRPQGIKGGLRLLPQFDDWDDFENLKTSRIFLKPDPSSAGLIPRKVEYRQANLKEFAIHQKFLVLFFEEAPDMDTAEAFRGLLAYVYEEELWDLPEGRYYGFQLEGLEVFDTEKQSIVGTVKALRPGVHDYLVVAGPAREFLVPHVPEMVKEIDLNSRRITVQLPAGLDEI